MKGNYGQKFKWVMSGMLLEKIFQKFLGAVTENRRDGFIFFSEYPEIYD